MLLKIHVLWYVMLCNWANSTYCLKQNSYPRKMYIM